MAREVVLENDRIDDLEETVYEERSPGYLFRQEYLNQLNTETMSLEQIQDESDANDRSIPIENEAVTEVYVHRTNLKEELIRIFKKDRSASLRHVKVIDERGQEKEGEGVGVLRDVIATFWQQLFASASVGNLEKVPCIRHDFQKLEWQAIGRILVYGFKSVSYFPVALSSAFLASCLFGEESISKEFLLASFRFHLTADEREIFDKLKIGEVAYDDEDVLDFLGSYKTFKVPNKENISVILYELAHQELIQRPRYIGQCWAPILCELKRYEPFKNPDRIAEFLTSKTPSARKV
ncbi:uncharacterized protein [Montipora foliosa]|uniref:uncharacterized protein isoform X4 n=2 Tax=Montipora TaxID=46703 RepID=UPI0035F1EC8A